MNKIFKVVWSKVKHCYVVVSEIAKNTISGGARRCRVRKGALAAALVTAFLSSSFAMPNSAWAASMGNSYEALVVLNAVKNDDGSIDFGIDLWRGDSSSAQEISGATYVDSKDLPKELKRISGYKYTKVSSIGAQTEFAAALEQTIINQIYTSVKDGENIIVTPEYGNNGEIVSYKIDARDTKNDSISLSFDADKNLVVSVTDTDGTNTNTESGSVSLADLRNAIDTNTVLKTNDSNKSSDSNYESYKGLDISDDKLVLTVKDTAGNVVSGSAEIGTYVSEKITNEAGNAIYNNTTIKQQITQNITDINTNETNITNLTKTVNAGWVAKITNNDNTVNVKTITPTANYLNFIAGDNVTLENENGAIKINASLNSGGSSEIDLNAGENIKLENNNQNGSITIIADIEGEGYKADWQQQRLMASAQDDSGQEVTGEVEYEGQLTKLRIGSKVYSVPVIAAIENAGNEDPLLRALELDGKAYRVVSTDYRLVGSEVTGENSNISYTGAYQVTRGEDGKNKVELNVYDNYSGVLANDKIVITGMATQEEFNALNFGVIKTTTGTGEETVTTNKLGLVGSNSADFGSVEVTTAKGSAGVNDATITFGGANGFTLDVGSTVRANVNDLASDAETLTNLRVNGQDYKLFTGSDVATNNNLRVEQGYANKESSTDETLHGWVLVDDSQKDSNNNPKTYSDTTLKAGSATFNPSVTNGETDDKEVVYGGNYTISDTAGNEVVLNDVASAEALKGVADRVTIVEENINQINQNINAAKTEVKAGESGNVTVTTSHDNGDGHTIYTIDTKNTVTSVEAGNENITVEPNIDGDNRTYKISAKNTVNSDMSAEWDNDNVIVAVKDSDGNVVSAPIENVAKASDLKQEIKARKDVDSALAGAIISNQQDVQNLNAGLNKLGNRMNKVGAGSAALAALHPMDFDPDDKLQFSAGVGHYGGENAAALGAFYRPTEKVMFSVAGTMGNGEDMVNAGVTFALDKPNNVSNSRVAMAREIQDLRQQVAALTMLVMQMASRDNAALAGVAMFPDVPENHWAYDYIEGLQKQGIIEGYPDGNFGGDRSMTRYEFAAMLYRALEKGFPVDSRLLNEFNAELGRIRVDRIKGADNDAKKVERVRVNADVDRDDYGSKIVQVKAGA